jgi:hypothetical protein
LMSALPSKADIPLPQTMSDLCQKRTSRAHSITSSASATSEGGTVSPSAAVLALIMSFCSTAWRLLGAEYSPIAREMKRMSNVETGRARTLRRVDEQKARITQHKRFIARLSVNGAGTGCRPASARHDGVVTLRPAHNLEAVCRQNRGLRTRQPSSK